MNIGTTYLNLCYQEINEMYTYFLLFFDYVGHCILLKTDMYSNKIIFLPFEFLVFFRPLSAILR